MSIDGAGRVLEKVMGNDEPQQVAGCRANTKQHRTPATYVTHYKGGDLT